MGWVSRPQFLRLHEGVKPRHSNRNNEMKPTLSVAPFPPSSSGAAAGAGAISVFAIFLRFEEHSVAPVSQPVALLLWNTEVYGDCC